jgi:hypothetical protein
VTIAATASAGIGIAGVQFLLDGVSLGAEDTAAPYQLTWPTVSVPSGQYLLTAVARDAAGHTATAAPVVVTVATQIFGP